MQTHHTRSRKTPRTDGVTGRLEDQLRFYFKTSLFSGGCRKRMTILINIGMCVRRED